MKKITTIIVLLIAISFSAMADGPKYGFASVPRSGYYANQGVRSGVTPTTTINTYRSGAVRSGRRGLVISSTSHTSSISSNGAGTNALGLSSSASASSSSYSGGGFSGGGSTYAGSGNSSVVYGRTSSSTSTITNRSGSSFGTSHSSTVTSFLESNGENGEGDGNETMEDALSSISTPTTEAEPLGDAILPLLLLMSLLAVYKWKLKK